MLQPWRQKEYKRRWNFNDRALQISEGSWRKEEEDDLQLAEGLQILEGSWQQEEEEEEEEEEEDLQSAEDKRQERTSLHKRHPGADKPT